VVYCAPSIAIAVLETVAHVDDAALPLNRYLIEIDVPDEVWARRVELDVAKLSLTWSAIPAGSTSVRAGSDWFLSLRSAILVVPSVIVPEERASLINPKHPESERITARIVRIFEYNTLIRS
jgi:RES domain-containing protein